MSANNHHVRIIRSSLFTFLIGKDKEPVTIHTALMEAQSKPLYAMMTNGHMVESKIGVAALDDVDMTVFMAFYEFLYGGKYSTPTREEFEEDKKSSPPNGSSEDKSTPIVKQDRQENSMVTKLTQTYAESASKLGLDGETVTDRFTNLYIRRGLREDKNSSAPDGSSEVKFTPIVKRFRWENPKLTKLRQIYADSASELGLHGETVDDYHFTNLWESFRTVTVPSGYGFLFHVKLYVFSTKYLIEGLSHQCLGYLQCELRDYKLSAENLHVIVDLLDYTYANTGRVEPNGKSLLRELVIRYAACKLRILAANPSSNW